MSDLNTQLAQIRTDYAKDPVIMSVQTSILETKTAIMQDKPGDDFSTACLLEYKSAISAVGKLLHSVGDDDDLAAKLADIVNMYTVAIQLARTNQSILLDMSQVKDHPEQSLHVAAVAHNIWLRSMWDSEDFTRADSAHATAMQEGSNFIK